MRNYASWCAVIYVQSCRLKRPHACIGTGASCASVRRHAAGESVPSCELSLNARSPWKQALDSPKILGRREMRSPRGIGAPVAVLQQRLSY